MEDCRLVTYGSLDFILWRTITHAHKQQTAIHVIPATTDTLIMSTVRMLMSCLGCVVVSSAGHKEMAIVFIVCYIYVQNTITSESAAQLNIIHNTSQPTDLYITNHALHATSYLENDYYINGTCYDPGSRYIQWNPSINGHHWEPTFCLTVTCP